MDAIKYVIFIAIYIISIIFVYWFVKRKFEKDFQLSEGNALLSEILEINFKNESLSNVALSIITVLKSFYKMDYITILLYNNKTGKMQIIASNSNNKYLQSIEEYCNYVLQNIDKNSSAKVLQSHGDTLEYDSASERQIHFSYFTLLKFDNQIVGGLLLENVDTHDMLKNESRMQLYNKVFTTTALVLKNVLNIEKLVAMTSTDQLTDVYNRRFIDLTLAEQLKIHKRLGLSMSIAIFDIDYFKKFNDTYGHKFGDIVLQEVAKYMKEKMNGENEWVARYGGEEFILFFGRSNESEVFEKVDALRQGLTELQLSDGKITTNVTASFGIASFPKFNLSVEGLIAKADKALYESKENGRNRVTIAK